MSLPSPNVEIAIIVAATNIKHGIGANNKIPWRIKPDMNHFLKTTTFDRTGDGKSKNAVIMGRKTYESIPKSFRPLSNRHNIVITRNPQNLSSESGGGIFIESSLRDAIDKARSLKDIGSIFIAGGGEIYEEAMKLPEVTQIYFTRVLKEFPECDTFFPSMHCEEFVNIYQGEEQEYNGIKFVFEIYERGNSNKVLYAKDIYDICEKSLKEKDLNNNNKKQLEDQTKRKRQLEELQEDIKSSFIDKFRVSDFLTGEGDVGRCHRLNSNYQPTTITSEATVSAADDDPSDLPDLR